MTQERGLVPAVRPLRFRVLATCLVASGAAALTYEVIWLRELSLVMGHTVYALAAVLDAFLGGLALGAYLGGRWTARRGASLALYAGLELGIAVSAVALPWIIRSLSPLFGAAYLRLGDRLVAYNLVQFVGCGIVLLVPTVLMGATLPVVMALLTAGERDITVRAGTLYAANSLGGALGALVAGFFVLPAIGMLATGWAAAALNVAGAVGCLSLRSVERRGPGVAVSQARDLPAARAGPPLPDAGWPAPGPSVLLLVYALSGFAALALEVAWSRVVSLSIGSTTYGFTIILFTYITGLALGSFLVPRVRFLSRDPVRAMFGLHVLIAVWSLLAIPYLGSLPVRVVGLFTRQELTFASLMLSETLLVAATILVPTLAMGGLFPLVAQVVHRRLAASGRALGSAYGANTLGNIVGSFVAGFVLVPAVGMRATIVVAALLSAGVAACYLVPRLRVRKVQTLALAASLVVVVAFTAASAPAWDQELVTTGPYLYGRTIAQSVTSSGGEKGLEEAMREQFEMVDYAEGATSVVTVKHDQRSGALHLQVGGMSDAYNYAATQNLIAHLPLLLHGAAREVLVVGLGSGSTLGSALKHDVERVTCVEISPEVRDMARKHFARFTGFAMDDPRARVLIADGRNHLRHTSDTYDVIVSQPSNPWISGAAGLFTLEYFRDVRAHLRPGGVACSWFKSQADEGRALESVLRTWREVFPEAYLFEGRVFGEYMIIGQETPGRLSAATVARGLRQSEVAADLESLSITEPVDILGTLLFGPASVEAFSRDAVLNTDDNAAIEFSAPRTLHAAVSVPEVLAGLSAHWQSPLDGIDATLATPEASQTLARRLARIFESKALAMRDQAGGAAADPLRPHVQKSGSR